MNTLEISKNQYGNLVATVKSEHERDMSAVIEDPAALITTLAVQAGIQINMTGSQAETLKTASGEREPTPDQVEAAE